MSGTMCSWRDNREAAGKITYDSFSSYTSKKYRSKSPSEFSSTSSDTSSSSSRSRRRRCQRKKPPPPPYFSEKEFPSLPKSNQVGSDSHPPTAHSFKKAEHIDDNVLTVVEFFHNTLNEYVSSYTKGEPFVPLVFWAH